MIGTESPAWNTSHTIRSATGLIAGPDRPPVTFARTGLRVRALIAIPVMVLIRESASAPPSTADVYKRQGDNIERRQACDLILGKIDMKHLRNPKRND